MYVYVNRETRCCSDDIAWIFPVQCCPKSIKTTLKKIFSYAMLSGASRITLNRVLTRAMLSIEY